MKDSQIMQGIFKITIKNGGKIMFNDKIKGAVAGLLIGTTLTTGLAFAKNGIETIQAEYSKTKN